MTKLKDENKHSLIKLFILELADPDQDLYPQTYLNEFYLFPELPPELRAKIWKHMFPPPREWYMGSKQSIFPPIVSRINQESRLEAMRHFRFVYFFKPAPEGTVETEDEWKYSRQRTCLNFNKDIVCIHERYIFKGGIPDDAHLKWMEENKEFPKAIRILHILQMKWEVKYEGQRREGIQELLKYFPNLKEIRLGRCLPLRPGKLGIFDPLRLSGVAGKRCLEVFNKALQAEHLKDPNFSIPAITIHDPRAH
jgi:hypothetical protein